MSSNKQKTREKILTAAWHLLEEHRGQNVHMRDIAGAAGISRQALYLHFASRTELMIATINYVDEVKGLYERLNKLNEVTTGIEVLETCVDVWGNYIPEIYGLAKAMLKTRDTDEATAAAWDGSMGCLRDVCKEIIEVLDNEGILAQEWTHNEATDVFFTILSVYNWEQLTIECGWTQSQYIGWIKMLLKNTLIDQLKLKNQKA